MFHYFIPSEGGNGGEGTHNSDPLLEGLKSRLREIKTNYEEEHTLLLEATPKSKIEDIMKQTDSNLVQEKKFIIEHLTLEDGQKESLVPTFKKIDSICKNLIMQKIAFDDLDDEYKQEERTLGIQNTNSKSHKYIKPSTIDQNRLTLNKKYEKRIDSIKEFVSSYLSQLNEHNNGIIKLIKNYPEPKNILKGFEEFIRNIKDYADVFINKFNTFINDKSFGKNKELHPPKVKKLHIVLKTTLHLKKNQKKAKKKRRKRKEKKKKKKKAPATDHLEIVGNSFFPKK